MRPEMLPEKRKDNGEERKGREKGGGRKVEGKGKREEKRVP